MSGSGVEQGRTVRAPNKGFIKIAVCELRFPALLELEEAIPTPLQGALRKRFPIFEKRGEVELVGNTPQTKFRYLFRSRDGAETLSLGSSSASLETTCYQGFAHFESRLLWAVEQLRLALDLAYYIRVGLRYVNELPASLKEASDWMIPALLPVIEGKSFGTITGYLQIIRGAAGEENYTVRHGIGAGDPKYTLDIDGYHESVDLGDLEATLHSTHARVYEIFTSSISKSALDKLSENPTICS